MLCHTDSTQMKQPLLPCRLQTLTCIHIIYLNLQGARVSVGPCTKVIIPLTVLSTEES